MLLEVSSRVRVVRDLVVVGARGEELALGVHGERGDCRWIWILNVPRLSVEVASVKDLDQRVGAACDELFAVRRVGHAATALAVRGAHVHALGRHVDGGRSAIHCVGERGLERAKDAGGYIQRISAKNRTIKTIHPQPEPKQTPRDTVQGGWVRVLTWGLRSEAAPRQSQRLHLPLGARLGYHLGRPESVCTQRVPLHSQLLSPRARLARREALLGAGVDGLGGALGEWREAEA